MDSVRSGPDTRLSAKRRQEIKLLLSEHISPAPSDGEAAGFADQWRTSEDFLQQFPPPQNPASGGALFVPDIFADLVPPMEVFPGAADLPVSGFFYDALHSQSPLANVFLTGFDQHNPLPFDVGDMYMPDAPGQEQEQGQGSSTSWEAYQQT
jgi:hypothetical protein